MRPWREGASLASLVIHVQESLATHSRAPLDHTFPPASVPPRSTSEPAASASADPSAHLRQLSLDGSDGLLERLRALSNEELLSCLATPEDSPLPSLLLSVAQQSEALSVVSQLRSSNAAAAAANLELAESATGLRSQLAIIRSTDFAAAQQRYSAAAEAQQRLLARVSTPVLLQELQKLARADEAEGERLEAALLGEVGEGEGGVGALSAEAFVKAYKAVRLRFHTREMKLAALS